MFQSKIFLAYCYFILLILVVSCQNQNQQIICHDSQRNAQCHGNQGNNNHQYCGWDDQTIQCFKYPCATTYNSICEACSVDHVAYVTVGDCNSINQYKCTGQDRKGDVCPFIYDPVCATFKDGSTQTIGNSCEACHNKDVVSYQTGQCPQVITSCPQQINGIFCVTTINYVCGVDANGNQITYDNQCYACKNINIVYTYPGQCV